MQENINIAIILLLRTHHQMYLASARTGVFLSYSYSLILVVATASVKNACPLFIFHERWGRLSGWGVKHDKISMFTHV